MNRLGWILSLAVTACGGGGGGKDGPDGGSSCTTVCWTPDERMTVSTTTSSPPMDITETECNPFGLTAKACPPGFACTGTDVQPLPENHKYTRPICEPAQMPIAPLVFDLPAPPVEGLVPVRLDFTLNGAAWPVSADPKAAGTIGFYSSSRRVSITRDLPTQSGRFDIDLLPGDYQTAIVVGGTARAAYPSLTITGTLTVVAAGAVQLDFAGQPLSYVLRLDGSPFPSPTTLDSVTLQFHGTHGQVVHFRSFGGGFHSAGVVMLEPDTYQVTLDTSSFGTPVSFPTGTVSLADRLEIIAPRTERFDVATYPISGTVRVDGADVPAAANAAVSFGSNWFVVTATQPARYQGRLYAGSYDVTLDTFSTRTAAIPQAATLIASRVALDRAIFDINATTTTFSGSVTLNGSVPPASATSRSLHLTNPDTGRAALFTPLSADGAWSTRAYTGTYGVSLSGRTGFPDYEVPLESNLAITAPVTRSYNVSTGTAQLTLLDGATQPIDATVSRGSFALRRSGSPLRVVESPPNTGPVSASTILEPGTWSVEFTTGANYPGLPSGTVSLGEITIDTGLTTTRTFTVHGDTFSGEIRRGGLPLPSPQPGHTRGNLLLFNQGIRVDLAADGPATFSARVFPGIYDVFLDCREPCDTTSSLLVSLVSGLRYP